MRPILAVAPLTARHRRARLPDRRKRKGPEAPAQSAPPARGREDGTCRGCSETNHRRAQIQPRATERLRNAHLARATEVPRAASGGHGTLHRDDDTAPPIRAASPRWSSRCWSPRAAPRPRPPPRRLRGASPSAPASPAPSARPRRARRPRRPPRPPRTATRPGAAPSRRPRRERPEREPVRRDRGARSPSSAASRRQARSSAACSTSPGCASTSRRASRRTTRPQLVNDTEACYKALALMPQDESLARPVHRAAHEPGRGPVRRRDQADVRRHEHGRDRPGREDHLRPRVHPRAPGPAVRPARRSSGDAKDQGDRALARSTLVEGDATLLMSLWAQQHLTPQELGEAAARADPALRGGPRRACRRSSRTRSCSRTRAASR